MERVLAAMLAAVIIGFMGYLAHVILTLMGAVVPIWFFAAYAGAGFVLSVAYDVATTLPPRKESSKPVDE
jgi:hypothetical protein